MARAGLSLVLSTVIVMVGITPGHAQEVPKTTPAPVLAKTKQFLKGSEPDPAKVPALKSIRDLGAQISWIGRWGGLDGWVAIQNGKTALVYTTLDGKGIISGLLYDDQGVNVSLAQVDEAEADGRNVGVLSAAQRNLPPPPTVDPTTATGLPTAPISGNSGAPSPLPTTSPAAPSTPLAPPGVSKGEALYQELEKAHWFVAGLTSAPPLYFIFDPRCPHCKNYYNELAGGAVKQGKIHLRMIPVGLLSEESMANASALLASPEPVRALEAFLSGIGPAALPGSGDSVSAQKLIDNMRLALRWNIDGVPFSVYRSKDGVVKIIKAKPLDVGQMIQDITG